MFSRSTNYSYELDTCQIKGFTRVNITFQFTRDSGGLVGFHVTRKAFIQSLTVHTKATAGDRSTAMQRLARPTEAEYD